MAVTFGFYNSLDGDRKYNASHFNTLFDGIIVDGVFSTVYNAFAASPDTTNEQRVKIDTGKAWLNGTWTVSDTAMTVGPFDSVTVSGRSRIDAICIQIDKTERTNSVGVIVKGTEATSPVRPTLTEYQYPICYVTCNYNNASAPVITAAEIEYVVGQSDYRVPFVTAALQTLSIDALVAQWEALFNEWFDGMKQLPDDSAAYLNQRIDDLIVGGTEPCTSVSQFKNGLIYVQYEDEE